MGWVDVFDAVDEFMPRRWKRKVSVVVLAGFLLFPNQARDFVLWYGGERAKQITEKVLPAIMPTSRPASTLSPSP